MRNRHWQMRRNFFKRPSTPKRDEPSEAVSLNDINYTKNSIPTKSRNANERASKSITSLALGDLDEMSVISADGASEITEASVSEATEGASTQATETGEAPPPVEEKPLDDVPMPIVTEEDLNATVRMDDPLLALPICFMQLGLLLGCSILVAYVIKYREMDLYDSAPRCLAESWKYANIIRRYHKQVKPLRMDLEFTLTTSQTVAKGTRDKYEALDKKLSGSLYALRQGWTELIFRFEVKKGTGFFKPGSSMEGRMCALALLEVYKQFSLFQYHDARTEPVKKAGFREKLPPSYKNKPQILFRLMALLHTKTDRIAAGASFDSVSGSVFIAIHLRTYSWTKKFRNIKNGRGSRLEKNYELMQLDDEKLFRSAIHPIRGKKDSKFANSRTKMNRFERLMNASSAYVEPDTKARWMDSFKRIRLTVDAEASIQRPMPSVWKRAKDKLFGKK